MKERSIGPIMRAGAHVLDNEIRPTGGIKFSFDFDRKIRIYI